MKYDYEPLLDPSCNYQLELMEYKALSISVKERLDIVFHNPMDAPESELKLVDNFDTMINDKAEQLTTTFRTEYLELVKEKKYFLGCPFDIYQATYQERLGNFLTAFPDADERDFLNTELDKGILTTEYEIYGTISKTINFSLQKRLDFLKERAVDLGFEIDIFNNESNSYTHIIKKIEPKALDGKQNEVPSAILLEENPSIPLIKGEKLNILERYRIAQEVLNIETLIRSKNNLETEKHILLALILGCNQQVARELFNGTYNKRAKLRENLINEYLKTLK